MKTEDLDPKKAKALIMQQQNMIRELQRKLRIQTKKSSDLELVVSQLKSKVKMLLKGE